MNNELTITFVQHETGKSLTIKVEAVMSAAEVVAALVQEGFLTPENAAAPYVFKEKPDGVVFSGAQTFESAGVHDGATILISAEAGPGATMA